MIFIEVSLEPDKNVVVLDGIRDGRQLFRDDPVLEQVRDLAPIVFLRLAQPARLEIRWRLLVRTVLPHTHICRIRRLQRVVQWDRR